MKHRLGALRLDACFALAAPWTVLFGPSGSGKTTVLRTIAGFLRPNEGTIVFGANERLLVSTRERVFVAAHRRPVRSAAQAARLFPSMNVEANVRYGMGLSHHEEEAEVLAEVLALMRLATLAARRPDDLSGGERQRVSVARAVASAVTCEGSEKALLLLDEPFTGIDGALRDELAIALRDWLAKARVPVLSVSHDVGECHLLRAEIVKMAEGQVLEQGPAGLVLAEERERELARLKV
ncbi:MAG: ATP-binding cassette domain-containing protein [Acidobacteriota bacterium]|nr:ATP-binding cassette domain-containing protein [Acidobacteriota bacterium]